MKFEKPLLMGHSMGAATVMRIGAEYPDLAKAIIMLDPFVGRGGPGPRFAGARGPQAQGSGTNAAIRTAERRKEGDPADLVVLDGFGEGEGSLVIKGGEFRTELAVEAEQRPGFDGG